MSAWRFILVAEDALSARNVRVVVDALLEQRLLVEWGMQPSQLDTQRRWTGLDESHPFTKLTTFANGKKFGGGPQVLPPGWAAGSFALQVHKVHIFTQVMEPRPELVMVAFDRDDIQVRRNVVEGAHAQCRPDELTVALFIPEAEAWPIVCFAGSPETLASLRKLIGFDPTRKPERMDSTKSGSGKDCKKILARLGGGDEEISAQWIRSAVDRSDLPPTSGLPQFINRANAAISTLLTGNRP
jgi:hypothetical protein